MITNFGRDVYRPGTYAMIVESVPVDRRATAFSIMGLIAFPGSLIAPIVGGYLSLSGDYHILFVVSAMSFTIMTLLRQAFLIETKGKKNPNTEEEMKTEKKSLSFTEKLRLTWRSSPSTRAYLIFGVTSALAGSIVGPYFAAFYLKILNLDQLQIGSLATISLIPNMICQLPGGKIADRIGRKPLALLSLLSSPIVVLAITQATNFNQLVIIQLISGAITGLSTGALYTLPTELVAEEYRATALGVFNTTSQLAGAIGPSLGGLIILIYPFLTYPRHIFYISILSGIPSIILFAISVKETLRKRDDVHSNANQGETAP
jgi:MFS family permease